ncbi:MAG: hypothetical protein AB199_04175 [Parcubacteria bacterium C7867-004]|nr:MAG: hypothetical protein AB199_04175 [Parcubacteria bacterium C7867-004]
MQRRYRPYAILFIITVIAGGASIAYLTHVAETSDTRMAREYPTQSGTMSGEFATLTVNLIDHQVFSMSTTSTLTPDMWRTPGYPAFLAPFYALFGDFYPVLIAQLLLLFLTAVLIFRMAKRVIPESWALATTVLYIVLPTTLLSVATIMNETLFMFVFVSALYVFFFSSMKNIYARWVLTGAILGAAAYIKPAALYILPFFIPAYFLVFLPWKEFSRKYAIAAVLMVLTFAAVLAPWCLRNNHVLGSLQFASTSAFQLFRHNATQFYEAYNGIPNIEARYALQDRAGIPHGPVPLDPKYSEVLKKVAVEVILEHPFSYTLFHLSTFIPFFTASGAGNYDRFVYLMLPEFDPAPEPSLLKALHPFSFPTLLIVLKNHGWTLVENAFWAFTTLLVLLGLWYSKNRRLAWMFFSIMLYFALVTGPIAHARYRMPIEPLILIGAAATLNLFWENKKNGRKLLATGS